MFGFKRKLIQRNTIPSQGRWFFDNYEKLSERFDPTLVTEAIFDRNIGKILMVALK